MKIAFLGLGTMGTPMARNLMRGGHQLAVWNRTASRAEELRTEGARVGASPADAAAGAEIVLTMLADVTAVQSVITGADGVIRGLTRGAIVVDMSTVDPATARQMSEAVCAAGGAFIDAPVSGTRKPAVDATLLIMAGGPPEAIERARPALECMGRLKIVGGTGQGMAMKLVLNGLGAHMMLGLASVLVLGKKLGLGPRDMLEVISSGAFSSPLFAGKGERILQGSFEPDFSVALLLKDQRLVAETAKSAGVDLPTEDAVVAMLEDAVASGLGDRDMCAVVRLLERRAGVQVREAHSAGAASAGS